MGLMNREWLVRSLLDTHESLTQDNVFFLFYVVLYFVQFSGMKCSTKVSGQQHMEFHGIHGNNRPICVMFMMVMFHIHEIFVKPSLVGQTPRSSSRQGQDPSSCVVHSLSRVLRWSQSTRWFNEWPTCLCSSPA